MKLTMRQWAELDACAGVTRSMKGRPHQLLGYWRTHGAGATLARLGLTRWPSANRVTVTRKGFAALASKSKRFLERAHRIAERDYAPTPE